MTLCNTWKGDVESLVRALSLIDDLGPDERLGLRGLPLRLAHIEAGQDIVRQGEDPVESCLLIDGFVCRYKTLSRGQRQILSFHFPGEIPDLQSLRLKLMDHSLGALVASRVAFIAHEAIDALVRQSPGVQRALWKATLVDASIFREWLAGVGRRSAYERTAHLFCEMFVRMKLLGLAPAKSFHLPITQHDIADALGLSAVHVNRTLQDLRRDGLIATRGRYFSVEDWTRLRAVADFDPLYLHLRTPFCPDLA
ncbi:Crp/Fnr family transcriptional regulator [Terricaulis sp.]|uniref:Crp/Fnr family transcriptional regulator n=1 Tax=Terricaulis sp. TaxID=2768686 RepID=UPI002AC79DCE|nr:Crp/Fnr family transcriptional regulator [Terricaulis sp.]MDZ4690287.1 Crp/Fnr family transcriptional regulator [Terricaulis sp.]